MAQHVCKNMVNTVLQALPLTDIMSDMHHAFKISDRAPIKSYAKRVRIAQQYHQLVKQQTLSLPDLPSASGC